MSKEVPMMVRLLKDQYVHVEDVWKSEELSREALHRCIAEFEEWRRYWEPIVSPVTHDLDPIFRAYKRLKKASGDAWPLYEES